MYNAEWILIIEKLKHCCDINIDSLFRSEETKFNRGSALSHDLSHMWTNAEMPAGYY